MVVSDNDLYDRSGADVVSQFLQVNYVGVLHHLFKRGLVVKIDTAKDHEY